jgi:nucleoside 2-deoxyribosyltransferase-like protein
MEVDKGNYLHLLVQRIAAYQVQANNIKRCHYSYEFITPFTKGISSVNPLPLHIIKTPTMDSYEHYQPPRRPTEKPKASIFLAGSIDMGKARLWQPVLADMLRDLPIAVFNPRRVDFDPNLKQEKENEPFAEQVNWEMDYLEECDLIALYFVPGSDSPISLLELGLHAKDKKLIVCCPEGFRRKGNVDIVCGRHGIRLIQTEHEFYQVIKAEAAKLCDK